MKVLVDHQIFLAQKYGGISNYHSIVNRTINEMHSGHRSTILALGSNNKYIKSGLGLLRPLNIRGKKILRSINKKAMEWMLSRYDVFHPSYYDNYFLKARNVPPFVLTIHDVIPERFFNDKRGNELIADKKNLIYKAARIIAISETTKKSILDLYDVDAANIEVIPHGRPDYFDNFVPREPAAAGDKGRPYLLYVGLRGSYKNFTFFVQSVSDFLVRHDMHLHIVGPAPVKGEIELVEGLGLSSRVFFETHASMEDLYHFYNQAFCFVFPSLEEGFGLPLLEAATAGCPILCSDIEIFHEVSGPSALYFDPFSKDSLLEKLEQLKNDPLLRSELVRLGQANLQLFSWQVTAEKTLAVYRMAATTRQ